jgi:peptidyl-prolyl cis-trans isomerase SurA
MKRPTSRYALSVLAVACSMIGAPAVMAQENLFAPRVEVNGRVVTEYEVLQRALFVKLLGGSGDPEIEAEKALVDEKLKSIEAERLGIKLTAEQVTAGMNEFAGRVNLSGEEFIKAIGQGGIAPETFRDFVGTGLAWREVVRARFAGQVSVSEVEVDRAIDGQTRSIGLRVLLSELVLPVASEADRADATARAMKLRSGISSESAFASAASRNSASPTAGRGGRLDWMSLSNLPPALRQYVLALEPGQVSDPVQVPNAVVLFQLREIAEDPSVKPVSAQIEYAKFLVPDDAAYIADIRANSDRCTDLYPFAEGKPDAVLTVEKKPVGDIDNDIAIELAQMDPGESSVALTRGGSRMFLMLCSREPVTEEPVSRDQVREGLLNAKLAGLSEQLLEELRAAAVIKTN